MELTLYEDKPKYDAAFRAILALPVMVLGLVIYVAVTEARDEGSVISLGVAAFVLLLLWAVLPRKYVIMDDRLKIGLGGPLAFTFHYRNIKAAVAGSGIMLSLNLVTSMSSQRVAYLVRTRGMAVAISPSNRDEFMENLNRALADYRRTIGNDIGR
jgi:hypothetical protein